MSGQNALTVQRDIILDFLGQVTHGEWKVVVLDATSKMLVENVLSEDDILKQHVTHVEQIEERRSMNKEMDAAYILSPDPHIIDCLLADLERRPYRRTHLAWTSMPRSAERTKLEASRHVQNQIASIKVLNISFYPKESHLILFRDPWSFPILFHPACSQYVHQHLQDLAQRVVSICVSLGEYPVIRFHKSVHQAHEAAVLSAHLANFVQDELDQYAKHHNDFPPASTRPRGMLFVVDRSMDIFAPLVHEFTYQAMVHDLLPIKDGPKTIYTTAIEDGSSRPERKDVELSERDNLWVDHRHNHMKDVLDKLASQFQAFKAKNPQFAGIDQPNSLNNIKDMLAGLPQYQEGKEAFSLHLNMASDAMAVFQKRKLGEIASVEQSMSTGLDEDLKKPKNITDQVVRLLDEQDVTSGDRMRLIIQYLIYRDGLLPSDTQKLLAHAQLPAQEAEVIQNLELIGARVTRGLKDSRPVAKSLFQPRSRPTDVGAEDSGLSRFSPVLKSMLEEAVGGTLDQTIFPCTKPQIDVSNGSATHEQVSQTSLRSAKPTWARTRPTASEPRQRIIVLMAGGATYSESRVCYETSQNFNKDVYLATSHMFTPSLFVQQLGELSVDRRRLKLPFEQPRPKAPSHLFDRDLPPPPPQMSSSSSPRPAPHSSHEGMSTAMGRMNMSTTGQVRSSTRTPDLRVTDYGSRQTPKTESKLTKDNHHEKDKDRDKKKKLHFFGSKK